MDPRPPDTDPRPPVTVRPARDDEDLDAVNVGNSSWMGGAMMRELFASIDEPCGALIAELDGEAIGYGDYAAIGVMVGHRAPATVYVQPTQRGRGAGRALWADIVEACRPDRVPGIMTKADADDVLSLEIARAHGLQPGGLHIESELDLTAIAAADMEARSQAPSGLTIRALPSDTDESTWHQFAALHHQLELDTPDLAEGSEPTPYAVLRTFLPEPWQIMAAWAIGGDVGGDEGGAIGGDGGEGEEGEMVGFTAVSIREASAKVLNTHLTGVRAEYRGRGVATALKAAHAVVLAQAGWRTIRTQNMEGNLPILASNKKLGFRQARAVRDLLYDHPVWRGQSAAGGMSAAGGELPG
jgi:mycothiol synthase